MSATASGTISNSRICNLWVVINVDSEVSSPSGQTGGDGDLLTKMMAALSTQTQNITNVLQKAEATLTETKTMVTGVLFGRLLGTL